MAVTDLSGAPDMSGLPWWLQLGTGPNGEMPGGGVMGRTAVTPGANPGAASWFNYLGNVFSPFGTANAAEAPAPAAFDRGRAVNLNQPRPITPPVPAPGQGPPGYLGNTSAIIPPPMSQPNQGGGYPMPPIRPPDSQPSQGGGYPAPAGIGPPPQPPYNVLSGGSANTGLPVAPAAAAPVQGPLASRFVPVDRPNMDPLNRGGQGASVPMTTALNLGGLFGGRPAAANPANVPAANAQPVSAVQGPLARGGPMPQAAVNRLMAHYPGLINASPDQLSNYIRTQPWVRNLGG